MATVIEFTRAVGQLKVLQENEYRFAGVRRLSTPSLAEHSWEIATLALTALKKELAEDIGVNPHKLAQMALFHHIGRSLDHPTRRLRGTQRLNHEKEVVSKILPPEVHDEFLSTWLELQDGKTKEAQIFPQLHALNRVATIQQLIKEGKGNSEKLMLLLERTQSNITELALLDALAKINKS